MYKPFKKSVLNIRCEYQRPFTGVYSYNERRIKLQNNMWATLSRTGALPIS